MDSQTLWQGWQLRHDGDDSDSSIVTGSSNTDEEDNADNQAVTLRQHLTSPRHSQTVASEDPSGSASDRSPLEKPESRRTARGTTVLSTTDPATGVTSVVETGDTDHVTSAELKRQNFLVHKAINASSTRAHGRKARRDAGPVYALSTQPSLDFRIGNVIQLRWTEPTGSASVITRMSNEAGFTRTRKFVVVGEGRRHIAVLPIHTYNGQGVGRAAEIRAHHSIIYTGEQVPSLLEGEAPIRGPPPAREVDCLRVPIRVLSARPTSLLDPHSRLNYSRTYQIDQNSVEIYVFGRIANKSMTELLYTMREVQQEMRQVPNRALSHVAGSSSDGQSAVSAEASSSSRSVRRPAQPQQQPRTRATDLVSPAPRSSRSQTAMHTRDEYRERRPPESATLRRPGASAPVLPLAPRVQPTSQLSTNALAERLRGLTLMAGAYGVDLAAVRREHLAQVAQESTANQARYLAGVREALQRSNESSDED